MNWSTIGLVVALFLVTSHDIWQYSTYEQQLSHLRHRLRTDCISLPASNNKRRKEDDCAIGDKPDDAKGADDRVGSPAAVTLASEVPTQSRITKPSSTVSSTLGEKTISAQLRRRPVTEADRAAYAKYTDQDIGMTRITSLLLSVTKKGTIDQVLPSAGSARLVFLPDEVPPPSDAPSFEYSPVPLGRGIFVQPRKGVWLSMDDIAFSYDIFFEMTHMFSSISWLGTRAQQDPNDAFIIAEVLHKVQPDLVVEIGTNAGGGAIFYSTVIRSYNPAAVVLTVDVSKTVRDWDARRSSQLCPTCILGNQHPYWSNGSIIFESGNVGTDTAFRDRLFNDYVSKAKRVLVIEDASHKSEDVVANFDATWSWVSLGSYFLVQDTKLDRLVPPYHGPMHAVELLRARKDAVIRQHFRIDRSLEYLMYSQHHRGWLKRVK